ncbi:hypothetical protein OM317_02410 [Escherichia albertii]|nr:hypothetical protein [Shigella boydii]MCZ8579463.1 hypothetical protein [Escherichia albertii]EFZ6208104.1 hypothetical protein [Shigella boydii]EFZ8835681.1 hypothetical protein [Shigella boydii]MCZ8619268.1 hypothetical protein [Escherichia albertii]
MTALNKQAYRADGGDIGIGRLKEIADNAYSDEEKRWLAQRVMSLLDEIEKLEKVSEARKQALLRAHKMFQRQRDRAVAAEKRIAELEARTVTLPTPYPKGYGLVSDKYNFALEECADAIRAAGIGVKGE